MEARGGEINDAELFELMNELDGVEQEQAMSHSGSRLVPVENALPELELKPKRNRKPKVKDNAIEEEALEQYNIKKPQRRAHEIKLDAFMIKKQEVVKIKGLIDKAGMEGYIEPGCGKRNSSLCSIDTADIYFPYKPYVMQLEYMKTVLSALANRQNALLESPTGSGKTICLLTSCLAYVKALRDKGDPDIKILYMSRTHSQLQQVVKELRKTAYRPKMMILGSRDHTCVNNSLNQFSGYAKKLKCKNLMKTGGCVYYENLKTNPASYIQDTIFDIEDLLEMGRSAKVCPYHFSKKKSDGADIVFLPYNYIIDKQQRDANLGLISNSILIFDEAHNIQSVAEDGASISITISDVQAAISELEGVIDLDVRKQADHPNIKAVIAILRGVMRGVRDKSKTTSLKEHLTNGVEFFCFLESCSTAVNKRSITTIEEDEGKAANHVFKHGLKSHNVATLVDILKAANNTVKGYYMSNGSAPEDLTNVLKLVDFFKVVSDLWRNHSECSKQLIKEQDVNHFRCHYDYSEPQHIKVSLWCMNPYYTFREILQAGPRSVIVTSGTLSPIDAFENELRIPFKHKYRGKHVIDTKKQVLTCVMAKFNDKVPTDMSFKNRGNEALQQEIGKSLVELSRIVPEGMLVFFSSYAIMNSFISKWRASSVFSTILQRKRIMVESRDRLEQKSTVDNYIKHHKTGAMLFGVCGGKLSEGFDFSDSMARCVVIIGIPYASNQDTRIKAKREYLDYIRQENRGVNIGVDSNTWYTSKALRATNQALGRVIRHKRDYGVILLFDSRFCAKGVERGISSWAVDNKKTYDNAANMYNDVREFFVSVERLGLNDVTRDRPGCETSKASKRVNIGCNSYNERSDAVFNMIATGKSQVERRDHPNRNGLKASNFQRFNEKMQKRANDINSDAQSPIAGPRSYEAMDAPNQHESKKVNVNREPESDTKNLFCLICYGKNKEFWTSKCGHIACIECWSTYLKQKGKCFVCRKLISSKKQLIKLYLLVMTG